MADGGASEATAANAAVVILHRNRSRGRTGREGGIVQGVGNAAMGPSPQREVRRIVQASAASVSPVVSITSNPARKPGFTVGFGNTMRSSA